MEQRIFHGELEPQELAQVLLAHFNQNNYRAQQVGSEEQIVVQIATREMRRAGGQTALTVTLREVEDGVAVQIGKQDWLGVAASLGETVFTAWRNPFGLIHRLDDLAQDIDHLQLSDRVWELIEASARAAGATFELSKRLRRLVCSYCRSANPVGEPSCIACGAPLGEEQPDTCPNCGFVLNANDTRCPNCGQAV
jgi:DNA-directed RNA polymerase subunit RPC12/RpoP